MMTALVVAFVLLILIVRVQGYSDRYVATTTDTYKEQYGENSYDHKMYKLALIVYLIGSVVAGVTFFTLIIF